MLPLIRMKKKRAYKFVALSDITYLNVYVVDDAGDTSMWLYRFVT